MYDTEDKKQYMKDINRILLKEMDKISSKKGKLDDKINELDKISSRKDCETDRHSVWIHFLNSGIFPFITDCGDYGIQVSSFHKLSADYKSKKYKKDFYNAFKIHVKEAKILRNTFEITNNSDLDDKLHVASKIYNMFRPKSFEEEMVDNMLRSSNAGHS